MVHGGRASARFERGLARTAAALLLAVLIFLVGRPIATDDFWWHLALGRLFADGDPPIRPEPFFFTTPGQQTVPHEWLFQRGLFALHQFVGFQGLRLLHVAAVLWILFGVQRACRAAAQNREIPALLATAVFVALSWYRLFQLRPELLSLGALLLLERFALRPGVRITWRRGIGLGGLFLVWVNAHSLFLIGLALLAAVLAGTLLEQWLGARSAAPTAGPAGALPARPLMALLVVCPAVTLFNPRGLAQHFTFFSESSSGDIWRIRDDFLGWNPFVPSDAAAFDRLAWLLADAVLLLLLVAVLRGLWRLRREPGSASLTALDLPGLALSTASCVAMFAAARFHWLVLFPLLYLLRAAGATRNSAAVLALAASRGRVPPDAGLAARPGFDRAGAIGLALIALAFPVAVRLPDFVREVAREPRGYASPWLSQRYGGAAMRFLTESGVQGRAFHSFDAGGFLAWWLHPRIRSFIDGRLDHVPTPVFDDYLTLRSALLRGDLAQIRSLLDRWQVDLVLAPAHPERRYGEAPWIRFLRLLPEWTLVFASDTHSVFLRRAASNQRNFERIHAFYGQRGLRFDTERGFDALHALARRPAWARRFDLLPDDFEAWRAAARDRSDPSHFRALDELSDFYWRIGAVEAERKLEEARLRRFPDDVEAGTRLIEALLRAREPEQALAVHAALPAASRDDPAALALVHLARQRARLPNTVR